MENMKLLICSPFVPYDSVNHAGGQTHNYYVKRIKRDTQIDLHIVTFASREDTEHIDLTQYGISNSIIISNNIHFFQRLIRKFLSIIYKLNPKITYNDFYSAFNKYLLLNKLKEIKNKGYRPDIVELNWTNIILYLPSIKNIFPDAKYYAVEQDVTFQNYERNYLLTTNPLQHKTEKKIFLLFKNDELKTLKLFDKIFVFNNKDLKLLTNNGIQESLIKVIIPYFKTISIPLTEDKKNMILFYGAMGRKENYLAAIWFIENVFPLFSDDFVFVVLGSSPHPDILKYKSDRINITGYQADIQPYFEKALCLVAPLERGAGIKVKVLEALLAGIPVLGTEVASEGIDVTNGINFLNCKTPQDYYGNIMNLYNDTNFRNSICTASKEFIHSHYNFDASFKEYVDILYSLLESNTTGEI